jgi:hypothetical protein
MQRDNKERLYTPSFSVKDESLLDLMGVLT